MTSTAHSTEEISSLVKSINVAVSEFGEDVYKNESARVQALESARKLTVALEKPGEAVFKHVFMPNQHMCSRIALDLDLYKILVSEDERPKTSIELATISGGERDLIVRIMRVLIAIGFVAEVGVETYAPTPVTRVMTQTTRIAMMKHCFDVVLPSISKVPEYFRANGFKIDLNKTPFQYAYNTDLELFGWLSERPQFFNNFNTFMQGNRGSRPFWGDWFPIQQQFIDGFDKQKSPIFMIDIAGNLGHDLMALKSKFSLPGQLVLEDLPDVIDNVEGLSEDIQKIKYNFFTPQPVHGARIYFFHFILHDWSVEKCRIILRNTAAAMTKGYSKMVLNEIIMPDEGVRFLPALYDLQMLVLPFGMERNRRQWTELLDSEGFKITKFWPPPGEGEGIIEAELKD